MQTHFSGVRLYVVILETQRKELTKIHRINK